VPQRGLPEEPTRRNVELIARLEQEALARRGLMDRIVDAISGFCGTTAFVWIHVLWFTAWVVANVAPGLRHFDPFPFQFLTLVVSLEAILLSTFILISQNRQGLIAERRNQLDLQINLLAEQENTKTLVLLARIARKLGVDECDSPDLRLLEEEVQPELLASQIEEAMKRVNEQHGQPAE
jgi:uncharacterized membrane protein